MKATKQKPTKPTRRSTTSSPTPAPAAPPASTSSVAVVIEQIAELREKAFLFDTAAHMLLLGFLGEDGKAPRFHLREKGRGPRPANVDYTVSAACSLRATANVMKTRAAALAAVHVNAAPEMLGPTPSVGDENIATDVTDADGVEDELELVEVASLRMPRPRGGEASAR